MAEQQEAHAVADDDAAQEGRTFTQEEVNRLIGKEKAKYKGFSEYREKARAYDELKASQEIEQDKAEQELSRLRAENEAYRLAESKRGWAESASKETGVPAEVLAAFDVGSEEDMKAKADALKGYFEKPTAPFVDGANDQPPNPGAQESANDWLRSTIPNR